MINVEELKKILEEYKSYFPDHWDDEKYKWEAIKHFQDNWDIDASNFGEMLDEATGKTHNLLASGFSYPKAMIVNFAEADDEATRQMFRELYDESRDLEERVESFINAAETLRATHGEEMWATFSKYKCHQYLFVASFSG